jgi:hypothetical protein
MSERSASAPPSSGRSQNQTNLGGKAQQIRACECHLYSIILFDTKYFNSCSNDGRLIDRELVTMFDLFVPDFSDPIAD